MASSQDILNQIQNQYGNIGNAANIIESTIKNAYAPSVKALVEEGNTLRGQYYPAFFNEAQNLGTKASDMSPAARLAAMQQAGENMGQLYRTNLGLRDFYNTDINNLVGRAQNQYNTGYGMLKDLYTMALQGEQARASNAGSQAMADYFKNLGKGKTEGIDLSTIEDVMPMNPTNWALINKAGGKTISPIYAKDGVTPVGYNVQLPDGRMIQMGIEPGSEFMPANAIEKKPEDTFNMADLYTVLSGLSPGIPSSIVNPVTNIQK